MERIGLLESEIKSLHEQLSMADGSAISSEDHKVQLRNLEASFNSKMQRWKDAYTAAQSVSLNGVE